jgi:hypothetical protein
MFLKMKRTSKIIKLNLISRNSPSTGSFKRSDRRPLEMATKDDAQVAVLEV